MPNKYIITDTNKYFTDTSGKYIIFGAYSISCALLNVTGVAINPTSVIPGGTATLTFTANTGYKLPDSITVLGATYTWNASTGVVILSNVTSNVTISITGRVSNHIILDEFKLPSRSTSFTIVKSIDMINNLELENN